MTTAVFGVSELRELLSETQPEIATAFLESVKHIRNRYTLKRIAALISNAQWEDALDDLEAGFEQIPQTYRKRLRIAADRAAKFLEDNVSVIVAFDEKNLNALAQMSQNDMRLIVQFAESQRDVTRKALFEAMEEGINPIDSARRFRDSIGLTDNQFQYVVNYRKNLEELDFNALDRKLRDRRFDRTVNRAIRDGVPLDSDYIDKLVERYHERWIKYRSETIARTESMRCVNEGTDLMWDQSVEAGHIDPKDLTQTWISTSDGRTRDTHREMNGQQRKFGEMFDSPSGAKLRYPCDALAPAKEVINCRCWKITEISFDAQ